MPTCVILAALPFATQEKPAPTPPAPIHEMKAPPLRYEAPYLERGAAPALDGKLDDACWTRAPWTGDFIDIEGPSKPAPRYRTRAKLAWDDTYLYIAAEMEEPDVWATFRERDSIVFREPDFELFVDPDGDGAEYYEFETNCLGTIFDLYLPRRYRDGGSPVHNWNCAGLLTRIDVRGSANDPRDEDRGWTLEWAVPWASLKPPEKDDKGELLAISGREAKRGGAAPKPGDTWRLNFSRVQWKHDHESRGTDGKRIGATRPAWPSAVDATMPITPYAKLPDIPEDNWVWSPQWAIDMHLPDRWGSVTFVKNDVHR